MGKPQSSFWLPLTKLASFTLALKALNRKLQPHAADAKEVQWVPGADARNGFPRLK